MFRFAFDKDIDQDKNITNTITIIIASVIILLPITYLLSKWNSNFSAYGFYFILIYLFNALNTCLNNFARGTNHIKVFVGSSFVYTVLIVCLNIIFLTVVKTGICGYLTSMVLSYAGSAIFMFFSLGCYRSVRAKNIDIGLLKQMLRFSIPMIFSTTAWWAMNSIDKYMLIEWYGIGISGLYGVAQKLPTIISVLSGIFIQAWQISAISVHEDKESNEFYTNVYKVYEVGLYVAAAAIIFITKPLASVMFQKDYYSAYVFAPILLLSGVYSCLSSFLQSPFVAEKRSGALLKTTLVGLIFNSIANIIFLNYIGPIGATYATMIGFGITWAMRFYMSRRFVKIQINWIKTISSMCILLVEALLISYNVPYSMLFSGIIFCVIIMIHLSTIKVLFVGVIEIARKIVGRRIR
jgi:O-antigen/teichoic acid export membrane protein